MKLGSIVFILILSSAISCNKTTSKEEFVISQDTIKKVSIKSNFKEIKLNTKAKKAVEEWMEYQKLNEFIIQYHHISLTDAIFNANELSELSQQLKDSIRIDKFQIPGVKIRLNVLHTETLRLADMATIPKISGLEIQKENENILNAFSAINLKINNIINQENLNQELKNFIDQVSKVSDTNYLLNNSLDSIKK